MGNTNLGAAITYENIILIINALSFLKFENEKNLVGAKVYCIALDR
jgi:hypothetical protein